jgi:hypothetical protein
MKSVLKHAIFGTTAMGMAVSALAADTPYDLIRPVYPLSWDDTIIGTYDTTVTKKHGMLPKDATPASYKANAYIPDTLDQAYLDALNTHISPIRVNQAGYLTSDTERQFYHVGKATEFEVVDEDGKSLSPAVKAEFITTNTATASDWTIIAGTSATGNDKYRYQIDFTGPSGTIRIGHIPQGVPTDKRLRIKVGQEFSSTFIVSDDVYTMVRDAVLKFYGIQRSGNSESWFHGPSHTLDGGGPVVTENDDVRGPFDKSQAGTLEGGWYDCGDHLKESQTQMYAFMVAAVMAATNADKDNDHYAYNQSEIANTDGIPDMLREAKHGADFVLRSFKRAKGVIDDMALSVGNYGSDHSWWEIPDIQDLLPTDSSHAGADRGGPATRNVRLGEIGSNVGGETAAGLALVSKLYAPYDKDFADSCLMVAEKMYDFAKALAQGKSKYDGDKTFKNNKSAAGWNTPAYTGTIDFFEDMALASVALLYATGKKQYADDALRAKDLHKDQAFMDSCAGCFDGGWFMSKDRGLLKRINTGWAGAHTYALYALYKLILSDKAKATKEFGLTEAEWLSAIEDCVIDMIANLGYVSEGTESITLPQGDIGWTSNSINYASPWYTMHNANVWIINRGHVGNIFDVLAYADVAADLEKNNIKLPTLKTPNWKADETRQLGINQLNYMLGMNPWDISFVYGIGDKNDAHPHHRASNPEGRTAPTPRYKYRPPVGGVFGGKEPNDVNSMVPSTLSWEDYRLSDICLDVSATLMSSTAIVAKSFDRTAAPSGIKVNVSYVSKDSAIVHVASDRNSNITLTYSTQQDLSSAKTVTTKGKKETIVLNNLKAEKTYYFNVTLTNILDSSSTTTKWKDDKKTPFSFKTLKEITPVDITNLEVSLSGDSADITWKTSIQLNSKVYWSQSSTKPKDMENTGDGNADLVDRPVINHHVRLHNLKALTTYNYCVESDGTPLCTDTSGAQLQFTTPASKRNIEVATYQYEFNEIDYLNLMVYNNEREAYDSLSLRIYMTAKPDEIEKCAIIVDIDLCYDIDQSGLLSKGCENERDLMDIMRQSHPVRIESTYDKKAKTYTYYFQIPVDFSEISPMTARSLDIAFSSGLSSDNYATCETLRKKITKELSDTTSDWSWKAHSAKDGAEYAGIPLEKKGYSIDDIPINPYITVFRNDKYISGFGPETPVLEGYYKPALHEPPPENSDEDGIKPQPVPAQKGSIALVANTLQIYAPGKGTKSVRIFDMLGNTLYKTQFESENLSIPQEELRSLRRTGALHVLVTTGSTRLASKTVRIK